MMQGQRDSNSSPSQTAAVSEAMMRAPQKQTSSGCMHALPVCMMLGELVDSQHPPGTNNHGLGQAGAGPQPLGALLHLPHGIFSGCCESGLLPPVKSLVHVRH